MWQRLEIQRRARKAASAAGLRVSSVLGAHGFKLLFCLIAFFAPLARGQTVNVIAQVDRQTVPVGETVTLSLIFEGGSPGGPPQLPNFPKLQVQGISQSTELNIVNGQSTSRQTYSYTLFAAQVGDVTIPALSFKVGAAAATSQPLHVHIVNANSPAANPGADDAIGKVAFLRLIAPKAEVYLGEPFPVEIQLYFTTVKDVQMPVLKAEGFSTGASAKPTQTQVQVNGVVYNLAVFKSSATAARTGDLMLGPAECSLTLLITDSRPRRREPFDLFFGQNYQTRPTTLTSEPVRLRVLALPSAGRPASFRGAVGSFQMSVSAGPNDVAVGDPITVKVRISGSGQLDSLALPPQPQWRDFSVYPATAKTDSNDPLGLSGVKSFEQVVIPQNHEIQALPPVEFSYFDSTARAYRVLTNAPIPLRVRASASTVVPLPVATNAGAPNLPERADDIEHIRPRLEALGVAVPLLVTRPWFLGLQGVPLAGWLLLWWWRRRTESMANNPRLRRQLQVRQFVRQALTDLATHANKGDSAVFFATLFRLLQEQLGERLDLPASAITEAVANEKLEERGLSSEALASVQELFQMCNQALYAPVGSKLELTALLPKIESAIDALRHLSP